ncbi:MAG: c-type cytochrome [Hyphomicrobium sp.]|uniref:c-type cytochrome n=1 Tax=Hyphomicrobium sp. TaxID=82 RepID=UPI0025C5EAE5|nr:c-type cytochrome [Hyphomicrobium sp.]MBZ0208910.1 c-type cytochrome [Hyphomicrobium sp.]
MARQHIVFAVLLPLAFLGLVCPGVVRADAGAAHYMRGLRAKLEYCTDCHGSSGRGYRGFYVMPRLAGQTPEYIENQLRAFLEGTRQSHTGMIMSRVHGIGPAMRSALADRFADLNPRPYGRAPGRLAERGKQIYEEGIPDANVPACSVCHGPEAEGQGPNPRLAGQLYAYTIEALANWDRERGGAAHSKVMQPIAQSLSRSEMEAVAAYLSTLN